MERSEWYAKLKEFHLCRDCKKQDAYTLSGHTRCYECAEKDRIRHACDRKDHDRLIKMRSASARYKQKCRSEGKCVQCGKFIGTNQRLCGLCAEKQRQASKKSKGLPPRLPGIICWQCNKKPCADGHKVCADCYEKKVKVALQNAPWRLVGAGIANARDIPSRGLDSQHTGKQKRDCIKFGKACWRAVNIIGIRIMKYMEVVELLYVTSGITM